MDSHSGKRLLFSQQEIAAAVDRLAAEISRDYQGKNPVFIGILKGVFIFMADLVRRLDLPVEIEFVCLSSYGGGRQTSGEVKIVQDLTCPLFGRDVLVVEDIIDTGLTLAFLLECLSKQNPESLKLCTLLDKPSRRQTPVKIDYLGLTVPDEFVVGYGLDCDQQYRNLPDIWVLED
jgi:hypoxanthine phosphoribosyltransferase